MTTITKPTKNHLTVRAGNGTLSFLVPEADGTPSFHPYPVKSGMSLAANLREAFKEQPYLRTTFHKAVLTVCTPVVLIPREDYLDTENFNAEAMYSSVITGHKGDEKIIREMEGLDVMALYSVNRDLKMVVSDNCEDVDVVNIMVPTWQHLYRRYYQNGERRKLFAYFHDKRMDLCSFEQRRICFANSFDAQEDHDALYYLLFVWKQLGMSQKEDDLFIAGDVGQRQWLTERLAKYITKVHIIDPNIDLNRSPLASIKDMPYDMMFP